MHANVKKTGYYLRALLFVALFMALAVPSISAQAATVTVCASGCDYITIQAAVAGVASGDTINVLAGTYVETGQIVINKNITIVGADRTTTIIQPAQNTGTSGDARGWFLVQAGNTFSLSNVTLDGNGYLIFQGIRTFGTGTIDNVTFTDIQYNPSTSYMGVGVAAMGGSSVTISNSSFDNIGRIGVIFFGAGTTGIFDNNIYTGKGDGNWLDYGVEVGGGATATISDSTFTACTGVATSDGSTSAAIMATTYYGAGTTATITGNTITGNTTGVAVGYDAGDSSTVTVEGNTLYDNDFDVSSTAPAVDASPNYFGTATCAGADLDGNVSYVPCYTDGTYTTLYTPPVHNTTQGTWYDTIQSAIDAAAAGDTIEVAAGTYTEQLTITKDITLIGAGAGSSIVAAPATLPTSGNATSSIVLISGSGVDVELTGFTITGPGPSACGSIRTGIYVYDGANANIHHNSILDIRDNPFSGCQNGVAIAVGRQAWATTGTATIANNIISGYQKGGIVVDNTGSSATITDNTITGIGTTSVIAQNGIQISRGATATLSGNTVSGNSFHLVGSTWDWGSAGILLYQAGNVTLAGGNTVSNNDQNLYIDSATGVTLGAETFGPSSAPLDSGYNVINLTTLDLDLTDVTFPGTTDNFEIEDLIWHGIDDPTLGLVTWVAGNLYVTPLSGTIQAAIDLASPGDTVNVAAGTYDEDVNINKSLTLLGAGAGSTTIRGVIGGTYASTIRVAASNVTIDGFTITRLGNNLTDWNNPGLNSVGIAIQGQAYTGTVISNNTLSGNRTGIDINNSNGHTVTDNIITDNRTGMIFRNQTDNMTVVNNEITNNWTVGILFLDASSGTNSPVQTALNSTFSNNNLSGNWYGQAVDRQTGGSLPLPGTTNLKNFVGNWWGTASPVVSTANSAEPGYSALIPVAYGGTATPPGGQPDILGTASANIIYTPLCFDAVCTKPVHNVTQVTDHLTIQAAIDAATAGDTIVVDAGTYVEDPYIDKSLTLLGPNAAINPNTGTRVAEAVIHPAFSEPDPNVCETVVYIDANDVTIQGFTFDGDNPSLTSGIDINGADVDACILMASYEGVGNIVVENNVFQTATYAAMNFYNYYNGTAATSGNYIRYNKIDGIGEVTYGWGLGILATRNFYADITDNVITHTRVGIQADLHNQTNPGTTGSVRNNQISTWRLGLFLNQQWTGLTPLTISGNTFTAENYPGATNWSGILVSTVTGTANTTISGNTITIPDTDTHTGYTAGYNVWNTSTSAPLTISGGTVTGGDYGIYVNNYEGYGNPGTNANNTAIIIDGVTILNSDIAGVYVRDDTRNTKVPAVTVYANIQNSTIDTDATGILVEGAQANAQANYNDLSGNPTAGITNLAGTLSLVTMDGTYNYWGSYTGPGPVGPGTGVNVSTYVDYDPFCGTAACAEAVHNETQDTYHFTIQAAIDAANTGDVIFVSAGTYAENVNVNKSVTIYGAGAGTIVMPALSAPNPCAGSSLCGGAASNVFLVAANNVVIHDLTVDGDNPALTSAYNIGGANLDARNGIITNHALGVFNGLEIYNVTVQNIYLRGIYPSSGGTFNIHHNTVTNVQGEDASIAIMNWVGAGIFANNTVSHSNDGIVSNHSSGTQYLNNTVTTTPGGIHTDNNGSSGGVADLLQGNNVNCTGVSNGYGVWVFAPYLNASVDNNTVTNCAVGLTAAGSYGGIPTFTNNTVDGQDLAGSTGVYITTSLFGWGSANSSSTFTSNIIRNTDVGFELESEDTYTLTTNVSLNQITGNTAGTHLTGTGTFTTNFEHNWWGNITGPSGVGTGTGDPISAGLDYTRWCGDAACTFFEPSELGMPFGTLTSWDKSFNWVGVDGATTYLLQVYTAGGTRLLSINYAAASICSGTTCSANPGLLLDNGSYKWRVRDTSTVYGTGVFTAMQDFTLSIPIAVLGSPSGTLMSWDKYFNWTGVSGATSYYLQVRTASGTMLLDTRYYASSVCSGMTCRVNPGLVLANGTYQWRIRDYSTTTGYGLYTAWQEFTLSIPISVLGSPVNTMTSWDKSFNWTGVDGATSYVLQVYTESGIRLLSTSYSPSSICVGTTCRVNSGLILQNGDYKWRVRHYDPVTAAWVYTDYQHFTLDIPIVVLGSPSDTLTSWNKTFNWTGVDGASQYYLQLRTTSGTMLLDTRYYASSVCSDTTCSVNSGLLLENGSYEWRIRDYNATTGYGLYTAWKGFTLNIPMPVALSPASTLTTWDNTFNWTGVDGATMYTLQVYTAGGTRLLSINYAASSVCIGTTCSVNPGLVLANGSYQWHIRAYNPTNGYGLYTPWLAFTLALP